MQNVGKRVDVLLRTAGKAKNTQTDSAMVLFCGVVAGVCRIKTRIRQGGHAEENNQTEVRT